MLNELAAVVMYNYLNWFPNMKIIFMAPTRPLVTQQVEACHDVVGIPEGRLRLEILGGKKIITPSFKLEETAELNGQTSPEKRKVLWKEKRIFYATPQTVEKDAQNGILPLNDICLLVSKKAKPELPPSNQPLRKNPKR